MLVRKNFVQGLLGLGMAFGLVACGDSETVTYKVNQPAIFISEEDELPGCGSVEKNRVYFQDGLFFCDGKKWVELVGVTGEPGNTGKDGTYCVTEAIPGGQKIVCDGDSVGVLKGASVDLDESIENADLKGEPGELGNQGPRGKDGSVCVARGTEDGSAIYCDGILVGEIKNGAQGDSGKNGENGVGVIVVKNDDGSYFNISGEDTLKIYGAVCGTETYDPEGDKFCSGISLMDKCGGKEYNPSIQSCCADSVFNKTSHFCASNNTVYALCNGKSYDVVNQVCTSNKIYNKCGSGTYNPDTHFCDTRDNHIYKYVKIGSQVWMAENLAYWTSGYYCYGSSNATYTTAAKCKSTYGWAYSFNTAKKACPSGWKLPTRSEYNTLAKSAGSAKALKSTSGWYQSRNGSNASGFNGYPNGFRSNDQFYNGSYQGYFWTSEAKDGTYAYYFQLDHSDTQPSIEYNGLVSGMSVRCLKK